MPGQEVTEVSPAEALGVKLQSPEAREGYTKFLAAGYIIGRAIKTAEEKSPLGISLPEYQNLVAEIIMSNVGKPILGFPKGLTREQCHAIVRLAGSREIQASLLSVS